MPLIYNETDVKAITYNSTSLTKVIYNGTTVWQKPVSGSWTFDTGGSRIYWYATYDFTLSGTNLGSVSGTSDHTYTISVPIYHSANNTNSYTAHVYAGKTSGSQTIDFGTQAFTATGTFSKTVTSSTWIGNTATIYVRVVVSNASYLTTNSNRTITFTATSGT